MADMKIERGGFEYKCMRCPFCDMSDRANILGREGWQLIISEMTSILDDAGANWYDLIFERPLVAEKKEKEPWWSNCSWWNMGMSSPITWIPDPGPKSEEAGKVQSVKDAEAKGDNEHMLEMVNKVLGVLFHDKVAVAIFSRGKDGKLVLERVRFNE
jgi:hypothetical protein